MLGPLHLVVRQMNAIHMLWHAIADVVKNIVGVLQFEWTWPLSALDTTLKVLFCTTAA